MNTPKVTPVESTAFDVDLSALLRVFGGHLYSTPAVFARELVQNGLDALTLRSAAGVDFDPKLTVTVEPGGRVLRFEDNGVGLDRDGLSEHLGRVGGSSKRSSEAQALIGQFGIGLLSGFLVADDLVVETRKEGCAPLRWHAKNTGTYEVSEGSRRDIGTEVTLRLRDDVRRFGQVSVVRELLQNYVPFVATDVELRHGDTRETIGGSAPWDLDKRVLEEQLAETLGQAPLAVLRVEHGDDVAILWVLASSPLHTSQCAAYQHGVLVTRTEGDLLPRWASFVGAILETRTLSPTASRESFVRDEAWYQMEAALKQALLEWLRSLPDQNPDTFQAVLAAHRTQITAACLEDSELLGSFGEHLNMETNMGLLSMREIANRGSSIGYVKDQTTFARVGPIAAEQDQLVINACHVHEVPFLTTWARAGSSRIISELAVGDLVRFVKEASEHRGRFAKLLPAAQVLLTPYNVEVQLKRFGSSDMPAIFLGEAGQVRERAQHVLSGGSALQKALVRGLRASSEKPMPLLLNVDNGLVSGLPELLEPEMGARVVRILYLQAAALARRVPSMIESQQLSEDLLDLLRALPGRVSATQSEDGSGSPPDDTGALH